MKLITTLLILLLYCVEANAQSRLKLKDAVAKGLVKLNIIGNDGHTGRCVTVQTENTTSLTLDIDIDCGQKILCSDSTVQNLVITQSEHVRLTPKRIAATAVYAMCINAHKASPGKLAFRLGQMAQGALLRLTHFIEKKKYQNSSAQSAVWTITDNNEIASIGSNEGSDYEMTNALRGFIAKEKKVLNYPKAKPISRKETNIEGTFDIILPTKTTIQVILVDEHNKTTNILSYGPREAGILRINYSVKNLDYKAGTYYIVVRSDATEVKRERIQIE